MLTRSRVASVGTSFLLLTAAAAAQSVIVVDGLNRPGTHFLDLPAAEAAAVNGDTILLRTDGGSYHGVTTSKALTITGGASAYATIIGPAPCFTISGLAAGADFVLQNIEVLSSGAAGPAISVQACLGRVHLVHVDAYNYSGPPGLDISLCSAVTVRDGTFLGRPGLRAQNTTLAASGARFYGQPGASATILPSAGARLVDCTAWFSDVQAFGGNGWHTDAPGSGLELTNTTLSMTGASNASRAMSGYLGTQATPGFTAAVPAIVGQNSLLRIDPDVVLGTIGGASPIVGATATTATIPSFSLYGVWNLFTMTDPGTSTAVMTVVGFPANPLSLPGVEGRLWLDPAGMFAVAGVLGGYTGFNETMLPLGFTFTIQFAALQGATLELSPPAIARRRE